MILGTISSGVSNVGVDTDVTNFLTATGITQTTETNAVTTLVSSLKSASLWNKMNIIYPMISDKSCNLCTNSNVGAGWNLGSSTVVTGIADPFGGSNAVRINAGDATDSYVFMTIGGIVTQYGEGFYTFSAYLRADTPQPITMYLYESTFTRLYGGTLNLTTSWQRYTVTGLFLSGDTVRIQFGGGGIGFVTGENIHQYGCQVEPGGTASPLIVTSGAISYTPTDFTNQLIVNLKNPSVYILDQWGPPVPGWKGDKNGFFTGTTGYDLRPNNLNLSDILTTFNTHWSYYTPVNSSAVTSYDTVSTDGSGNRFVLTIRQGDGSYYGEQYDTTTGRISGANGVTKGYYIDTVTSNTSHVAYKNGVSFLSAASSSGNVPNTGVGSGVSIAGNFGSDSSPRRPSFISFGAGLTAGEASTLSTIVNTFQTSLGRNVY